MFCLIIKNVLKYGVDMCHSCQSSLSRVTQEITNILIRFNPDSVLILRIVSRELNRKAGVFLRSNADHIVRVCTDTNSRLHRVIRRNFDLLVNAYGPASDHMGTQFHLSLPAEIRALGVQCHNRILMKGEVTLCNVHVQNIQDLNLQRIWSEVCRRLINLPPFEHLARMPDPTASALEIRSWMEMDAHLDQLRRVSILDLRQCSLTWVPVEVEFFTGLEKLDLGNNLLPALPCHLFKGLCNLRYLYLDHNQLLSLPPHLFDSLRRLMFLNLEANLLTSLPPGVFNTLSSPMREFRLQANPHLLVDYNNFSGLLYDQPRDRVNAFFNHTCRSAFAQFYQLAAGAPSQEVLGESFSRLPDRIKNALLGEIFRESYRAAPNDPYWEVHALDDLHIFNGALKRDVRNRFDRLTPEEKNAVYGQVYLLAQEEGRMEEDLSDPQWGEHHAFDNILRLIDAMSQLACFDTDVFWL